MLVGLLIEVHSLYLRARLARITWSLGRAFWAGWALLDVSVIDGVLPCNEPSEYEEDDDPKSEVDGPVHSLY